jgi:hypothetical protein
MSYKALIVSVEILWSSSSGYIQDVWYACGGRSQEQAMFRMNGIPTVINRKLCVQAKAGAESLPA